MSSSDKNNENKHSKSNSAGLSKFNLKALEKFENVNFKSPEAPPRKKHRKKSKTPPQSKPKTYSKQNKMLVFNLKDKTENEIHKILEKDIYEAKKNGVIKVKFIFSKLEKSDNFKPADILQKWLILHEKKMIRSWEFFRYADSDDQAVYVFL